MRALPAIFIATALTTTGVSDDTDKVNVPREGPLETRGEDTYMPPSATAGTTAGADVVFGQYVSHQINVNANGDNITNDAGNEPSIAVDPTAPNRMVAGWRQFDNIQSNFRQAGYSYSVDGGRTWAGQQYIEGGIFRSDPVLESGPDGTFYYLSLSIDPEFVCDVFISTDGGQTWPGKTFAFGGDKAWIVMDPTLQHIYQAWNTAGNPYFPNQFNRSIDAGATFGPPIEYDPINQIARPVFGILDYNSDGDVFVAGSQNSSNTDQFWVVRSSSISDPFGFPFFEQIVDVDLGGNLRIGTGPNPAGLLGQVNVAVDRSGGPLDGNVYVLCSVNPSGPDPMDVHFIRSEDEGQTWSSAVRVNDDANGSNAWQWFGQMAVAPNGRIDVVWNDTRNSGLDNVSALYYSNSTDGGVTWIPNVQISPEFDSWIGWPSQNKLGDYYDVQSDEVGADVIYAATFNGEQDVYYVRIGSYDCDRNGVADEDDIANGDAQDCNQDGIPDSCQIAAGELVDDDGDGVPDICDVPCLGDANDDGFVNVTDLLIVLGLWGPCDDPCAGDFDDDGDVDTDDLLAVLGSWGEC